MPFAEIKDSGSSTRDIKSTHLELSRVLGDFVRDGDIDRDTGDAYPLRQ